MYALRHLKATILMQDTNPLSISHDLQSAGVPVTDDPCRYCPDPCTEEHEPYPPRFDVDFETRMLGSVKPFHRQILISTGKTDWIREVTDESGSLAAYLDSASKSSDQSKYPELTENDQPAGLFKSTDTTRVSILNGSHHTLSNTSEKETVLVFPDFVVVNEVPRSPEGAQVLWDTSVSPAVPSRGYSSSQELESYVLPYAAVFLLCSHKRRDNRCAISAPKLEHRFSESLETKGWMVDAQIDEYSLGDPLERLAEGEDRESVLSTKLEAATNCKRALILKTSHIGGHKFAGNVAIYLPNNIGVFYGRVSTHEVESIVVNTLQNGKILPALLRGGLNIAQPGHPNLLDW